VFAALLREADLDPDRQQHTPPALNEDQNFYGRSDSLQRSVLPALEQFIAAADAFITLTARAAETASPPRTTDRAFPRCRRAGSPRQLRVVERGRPRARCAIAKAHRLLPSTERARSLSVTA
jgi:hypothetical protein